jgi:hypothetical protein
VEIKLIEVTALIPHMDNRHCSERPFGRIAAVRCRSVSGLASMSTYLPLVEEMAYILVLLAAFSNFL